MRRRQFLAESSRAALTASLLPLAGCTGKRALTAESNGPGTSALVTHLERQIPLWMQESKVPGLSIAVIHEAKIAWRRGFGIKDRASGEPVDVDTMFEAASTSKPVFAYAVMKLCEQGVLHLDTPLTRYTSERFVADDPRLDLITPRHLLSHTSGLQNWRSGKEPLRLQFNPGEKWLYSGEGYYYLQSVVTRLTGRVIPGGDCAQYEGGVEVCATDFDAWMKANLFASLGMASSCYLWNDTQAARMARPHDLIGEPNGKRYPERKPSAPAVARYGSAGALLTTPTDYARFLIEVIEPRPARGFRLGTENVREMLRPHVKLEGPYPSSWALGWQIFHNQRDFIYHGGDNKGFHCGALASVEGRCGYVVMTNGDNGPDVLRKLVTDVVVQQFLNAS
jgi:CubicO group peptidase (beta-lactamase class C family)